MNRLGYNLLGLVSILMAVAVVIWGDQIHLASDSPKWVYLTLMIWIPGLTQTYGLYHLFNQTHYYRRTGKVMAGFLLGITTIVSTIGGAELHPAIGGMGPLVFGIPMFWCITMYGGRQNKDQSFSKPKSTSWIPKWILGINLVQILIYQWILEPSAPFTTLTWVTMLAIMGIAFPITLFTIQAASRFEHFKNRIRYPGEGEARPIHAIVWSDPKTILTALKTIKNDRNCLNLDDLLKIKMRFNLLTESRNWTDSTLHNKINTTLLSQIEARQKRSTKLEENIDSYWCARCNARLTTFPIYRGQVAGCHICKKDDTLITNAVKVIGVLNQYNRAPSKDGKWRFKAWMENSKTFIPAEYDEIRIDGEIEGTIDWFISAMLKWRLEAYPKYAKIIPVVLAQNITISENAMRQLQDAAQKNLIQIIL